MSKSEQTKGDYFKSNCDLSLKTGCSGRRESHQWKRAETIPEGKAGGIFIRGVTHCAAGHSPRTSVQLETIDIFNRLLTQKQDIWCACPLHLPFFQLTSLSHTMSECRIRDQLLLIASEVNQISWEGRQSYLPELPAWHQDIAWSRLLLLNPFSTKPYV